MSKKSQEWVMNEFKINNCILLSEYKNCMEKVDYQCSCGNIAKITYNNFKKGSRCKECKKKSLSKLYKKSQEDVNQTFLDAGCECLDVYVNNKKQLKYKCSCGNISYTRLDNFLLGHRCKKCGIIKGTNKRIGEQNSRWNPDRNKIRTIRELHSLSGSYKKKFRKIYNIDKSLHIDHIFPIKAFVEHGILNLDIINRESNLRAISPKINLSKKDKYNKSQFRKKYKKEISDVELESNFIVH